MTSRATGPALSLGRALLLARTVIHEARALTIDLDVTVVGDARRFEPEVTSLGLLVVAPADSHPNLRRRFETLPSVQRWRSLDDGGVELAFARGTLDVHFATREQKGPALVWHTGSRAHVERLQARAAHRGLTLARGTLTSDDGAEVSCPSEEDLYGLFDIPYIVPELRAGTDEVERAESDDLPQLIALADIRGDLHSHTNWSDGRDSTEQMVNAARSLGYAYVAITDHSARSPASRTLSRSDVLRQREELAALRATFADIDILHGIEVDILPDGELDFDDALLASFDIVLASLHIGDGHGRQRITERYLGAIRHPLVNIITHPANRTPAYSSGFDVDFEALFAAAAATGTAMEIDGAPNHLDMDGAIAKRAVAAGVTIAIDSDCHRADWLRRQMRFGIGTARRGWIEPASVLNTRPVEDVRAFVARKRSR